MKKTHPFRDATQLGCLAAWLAWVSTGQSAPLLNFPFNEGTGTTTTDTVNGLVGVLGVPLDPAVDTVTLMNTSPSGLPGDRCITNSGGAFLIADDSAQRVLEITNGPITMETWVFIDPFTPAKPAEGIVAYGGSYKLGMKGGRQVFTLYGKSDITNTSAYVDLGRWVHLAAAWEPGQGVHFYLDGAYTFVANTNETARPLQTPYLSLGSEGLANNLVAALDRVRIHHALLPVGDLDSDAANPKAPLASTIVAYNFNEAALPCLNSLSPSLPAGLPYDLVNTVYSPLWTNDTPSGLIGDFALAFVREDAPQREFVNVPYGGYFLDLGANNTSYTLQAWVKLPKEPLTARRVIFRTAGDAPRASLSINLDRTLFTTLYNIQDFYSSVVVPNDNRWHHVAAAMEDFSRVHFYLDGVLRQTIERTAGTTATASGTNSLLIGKESESLFFRGLLDRVVVHNTALTANELDFPAAPERAVFQTQPVGRLVDPGTTVTFTATVSSPTAATYRWHRRTDLASPVSVPVQGQNTPTLTLNNVTENDEGVYSLFVTNAAGVSESYGARLTIRPPSVVVTQIDFESPTYNSGGVAGQDSWTLSGGATPVQTASEITSQLATIGLTDGAVVYGGSQALFVCAPGVAASTLVRPVTGLENEGKVIVDIWARALTRGNTVAPVGNVFFALEGTDGATGRATYLGFRIPHSALTNTFNIDYGSGVVSGGTWLRSGLFFNGADWYQLTAILDYSTKTYDFYVNNVEITKGIPFVHPISDYFRQLRIYRGGNQVGMIMDDFRVSVPAPATLPELGIRKDGASVVIYWPATVTGYTLKSAGTVNAAPETWTTVPHSTVNDEHQAVITPAENSQFFRLVK